MSISRRGFLKASGATAVAAAVPAALGTELLEKLAIRLGAPNPADIIWTTEIMDYGLTKTLCGAYRDRGVQIPMTTLDPEHPDFQLANKILERVLMNQANA